MNDHRDNDDDELQRIRELRRQAGSALLEADEEGHQQATDAADDLLVQLAQRQAARAAAERSEQARTAAHLDAINDAFARDHGDLLENDDAFADAQALMNVRLQSQASLTKTPAELAHEVGTAVRRAHGVSAAAPQPTPVEPARTEVPSPNVEQLRRASAKAYVGLRVARGYQR